MNILMLGCKEYPYGSSEGYEKFVGGGIEKYVPPLIEGLRMNNHNIFLVTIRYPSQKKYEKHKNLKIFRVYAIRSFFLKLITFSFFSFLVSIRLCRKNKIDIIHAHSLFPCFFALILGNIFRIKVIGTPFFVNPKKTPQHADFSVPILPFSSCV